MALRDIRREDLLGAIALLDDPVEGPRLLDELHFKPAKDYRLVYKGRFYPSKAVVGIAHGVGAGREYRPGSKFTGGQVSVVRRLTRLGSITGAGEAAEVTAMAVDQVPLAAMNIERTEVEWSVSTDVTLKRRS